MHRRIFAADRRALPFAVAQRTELLSLAGVLRPNRSAEPRGAEPELNSRGSTAQRGEPWNRSHRSGDSASPDSGCKLHVADLHEALEVVRQFDPPGIACRDLRECLLYQLRYHLAQLQLHKNGNALTEQVVNDAIADCRSAFESGDAEAVQGNWARDRASSGSGAGGARLRPHAGSPAGLALQQGSRRG